MAPPEELGEWLALAAKLRKAGVELIDHSSKTISRVDVDDPRVVALALLARTLGHLKSVVALIEKGMLVDALTLARSCYENSFRIARLNMDGEAFVREMKSESVANIKARGQTILENGYNLDPDYKAGVQDVLRMIKKNHQKLSTLAPKNVAKKTAISEAYLAYLVLSRDSHPTLSSLSRHLEYEGEGAEDGPPIFVVEPMPSTEELIEALTFACTAALSSSVGTFQIVGLVDAPPSLQEALKAYTGLAGNDSDPSEPK
jgi:hypothetical protein